MRISDVTLTATLTFAVLATTAFAAAHSDKALKSAVDARRAQMQLISYNTGVLGDMAKGDIPFDTATARAAAANLNAAARLDRSLTWVAGTEQGTVEGARAKPAVWTDAAGFEAKFTALQTAAAAMETAAGADLAAIQAAMEDLGGACKACHDDYRGPKN